MQTRCRYDRWSCIPNPGMPQLSCMQCVYRRYSQCMALLTKQVDCSYASVQSAQDSDCRSSHLVRQVAPWVGCSPADTATVVCALADQLACHLCHLREQPFRHLTRITTASIGGKSDHCVFADAAIATHTAVAAVQCRGSRAGGLRQLTAGLRASRVLR